MSQAVDQQKCQTCSVEEEKSQRQAPKGHQRISEKVATGRVYMRSTAYHMVGKHGTGKKFKWRVEDMWRLHRPEQGVPKYSYPLPNINHFVDNALDFGMLSFRDTFSGYNQVKMHLNDEEKTALITNDGVYYYRVIPFEMKNAGATYQRMMNMVFSEQIKRNMEAYVYDILIKSNEPQQH